MVSTKKFDVSFGLCLEKTDQDDARFVSESLINQLKAQKSLMEKAFMADLENLVNKYGLYAIRLQSGDDRGSRFVEVSIKDGDGGWIHLSKANLVNQAREDLLYLGDLLLAWSCVMRKNTSVEMGRGKPDSTR